MIQFDKIDPQCRLLIDHLFFTDRIDLDTSKLGRLLDNKDVHFEYLWDRFSRSSEIFWDEGFWFHRFELLLSLNIKRIESDIEGLLLSRFKNLLMSNPSANPKYHNSYVHFIAWSKAKVYKKENVTPIKDLLLSLPHFIQASKILSVVRNFVPHLFQTEDEYIAALSVKVGQSARSFEIIKQLESQGIAIDKAPLYKLSRDLLFKRVPNRPNRRSFFAMIDDPTIMSHLKSEYKPEHRVRLVNLIKSCEFKEIEEYHLRNIKNLLCLDESIADELFTTYATSLYGRGYGYKKANVQRLIRLCKNYQQFSPKKVLVWLTNQNRMADIKYLVSAYPELKVLVPFI
jgi:hypothetical protein